MTFHNNLLTTRAMIPRLLPAESSIPRSKIVHTESSILLPTGGVMPHTTSLIQKEHGAMYKYKRTHEFPFMAKNKNWKLFWGEVGWAGLGPPICRDPCGHHWLQTTSNGRSLLFSSLLFSSLLFSSLLFSSLRALDQ